MFGIGFFELVIIAIVALIFVGPTKLPEFMKTAGKFFVQMRRTANDVRSTFDQVVRDAEDEIRREEARELHKALVAATHGTPPHQDEDVDTLHNPDGTLKSTTPISPTAPHTGEPAEPTGSRAYQPGAPGPAATDVQWTDKTPPPAGHDK